MDSIIHSGIKCHDCQVFPIVGIRYKCLKCQNFDLCEQCEEKNGKDHGHPLLMLRNTYQTDLFEKKNHLKNEEKLKNPANLRPTFTCLNHSLKFKTINNNNFISIPIHLLKNGKAEWPLPSYFVCQEEFSQVKGEKVKINSFSKPNKDISFVIKLNLSNINKTGEYISVWRLEDEKGEKYGPEVNIKINDIFQEKLQLKPYYLIKKLDLRKNHIQPITTEQLLAKK